MIKQPIKAYIFDFDGTMMHTLPLWRDLDETYLRDRGLAVPPGLQTAIEGMGFNDCARYFQEQFGITDSPEQIIADWMSIIHRQIVAHPLKDDVKRFLAKVDLPMAIATSNQRAVIEDVLRVNQLTDRFLTITTSDEVGFSKPNPAVFLLAAKRLEVEPADCLVFEDTTSGVIGAKNAGMIAVAVFDPSNPDWAETSRLADYAITSFDEIGVD